jgi:hypothetical protein
MTTAAMQKTVINPDPIFFFKPRLKKRDWECCDECDEEEKENKDPIMVATFEREASVAFASVGLASPDVFLVLSP